MLSCSWIIGWYKRGSEDGTQVFCSIEAKKSLFEQCAEQRGDSEKSFQDDGIIIFAI
jgi:hypothetical protein